MCLLSLIVSFNFADGVFSSSDLISYYVGSYRILKKDLAYHSFLNKK